jgi:hypothetical protein
LITVVVLSSENGSGSSLIKATLAFSVSNEQTHVSLSDFAGLQVSPILVHTVEEVSIGIESNSSVGVIGDGISGCAITEEFSGRCIGVAAHVLNYQVANQFSVGSATVLVGPFNRQK